MDGMNTSPSRFGRVLSRKRITYTPARQRRAYRPALPLPVLTPNPGGTPHQPPGTNEQVNRIAKESRLVTFNQVAGKLKNPTGDKNRQRPAPVEEEPRQTEHDHWNADRVAEPVQRMLMFRFVVLNQGFRHDRRIAKRR